MKIDQLAFIGCGRMAEALIQGVLCSHLLKSSAIFASDVDASRLKQIKSKYKIITTGDNQKAAESAKVIILAVKPQTMQAVLNKIEIKNKLVISIAAGISLGRLERRLPACRLIRIMPNNPALVAKGISALAASKTASQSDIKIATEIFASVGEVLKVPEKMMDAVTGLSGSGPAFIYLAIEAMVEAGVNLGLDQQTAQQLAVHTVLGSAATILATKKTPRLLRDMVTSPGGTTQKGLKVLEETLFKDALIKAITAAAEHSAELNKHLE